MGAEGTVTLHKIVQIDHSPLSEAVLPHPLHQRLQLISRLEVRRGHHLVLNHHQMLVGVKLLRHWELRNCQPDGSLHENQKTHEHLLVALIDGLVGLRIRETLVVLSKVERSVGNEAELLIFSVAMVLRRGLVLGANDRESPHHHSVHDAAALLRLLPKPLILHHLHLVPLLLGHSQRLQHPLLQPRLPVLIHEGSVAVDDGVETGLVDLEQVVGDGGGVDAVVAHHSLGHIPV